MGIIASATTADFDLTTHNTAEADYRELEILLEAARRANWDALHGPRHLRSGRFNPSDQDGHGADAAAELHARAGEARPSQQRDHGPSDTADGSA